MASWSQKKLPARVAAVHNQNTCVQHSRLPFKECPDDMSLVRLLVASAKESGARLQTPLIASQGQTMNDAIIRIAVSICLDYILCHPHTSQQHRHQQKSFQKQQQRSGGAIVIISLKKKLFRFVHSTTRNSAAYCAD